MRCVGGAALPSSTWTRQVDTKHMRLRWNEVYSLHLSLPASLRAQEWSMEPWALLLGLTQGRWRQIWTASSVLLCMHRGTMGEPQHVLPVMGSPARPHASHKMF